MITTIVILSYMASIFLNRWLNKIIYEKQYGGKGSFFWFIPLITTVVFCIIILSEWKPTGRIYKWFVGDNWK